MASKTRRKPVSTTRSALRPVDDSTRSASNKNHTKAQPVAGDTDSLIAFANEFFGPVASRFEANAGYGRQHINSNGAVHPDAVRTKSNTALVKLAVQCMDVLAQRGALAGQSGAVEALGETGDPAEAKKFLDSLRSFAAGRIKGIQSDTSQARMAGVAKALGIDANDLVPAPKTSKPKPKGKSKAKADAESATA